MQDEIFDALNRKLDMLEEAINAVNVQKISAQAKIVGLEKQLKVAERLYNDTVNRINGVVTMIDEGTTHER